METLDLIITIGTVIGILILGFYGGRFVKDRDGITEKSYDLTNQLFLLIKIITIKSIKDEDQKDRIITIFDSIQDVFNYIYVSTLDRSLEEKKELAKSQIRSRLLDFGITPDENDDLLISLIVSNFVDILPKETKKIA